MFVTSSFHLKMDNRTLSVAEIEAELSRIFSDSEDDIFSGNTDDDLHYAQEESAEISG